MYGYGRVYHSLYTLLLHFSKFCVRGFFWNKHVNWDQCMYELELLGKLKHTDWFTPTYLHKMYSQPGAAVFDWRVHDCTLHTVTLFTRSLGGENCGWKVTILSPWELSPVRACIHCLASGHLDINTMELRQSQTWFTCCLSQRATYPNRCTYTSCQYYFMV